MEITKLLKITTMGATPVEPNGAMIKDGDMEYPVLLDSLTNTVIFPALKESGYKLIALPNTFEKDGISTSSLPVESLTPTAEQEADLYNLIGEKFNNGDLSQCLEKATVETSSMPKTDISITTREEFLQYLEYEHEHGAEIPIPLGYFVSQAALFTFEEYRAEDNQYYRSLIEARHRISYNQYLKLCAFFKDFGLSEDATYFDIISLYMSWGIDGVKYTIINSETRERKFTVYDAYVKSDDIPTERRPGFIDNKQTKFVEYGKQANWSVSKYSQSYVMAMVVPDVNGKIRLPDNQLLLVDYTKPKMVKSTVTNCSGYEYIFDDEFIYINNELLEHVLSVESNFSGELIPTNCLGLNHNAIQRYYEWQYLYSVANDILDKRIKKCDTSSFKLLQMFNYTPVEALRYVALKAGYTPASVALEADDDAAVILPESVYTEFCSSSWNTVKEKYGDNAEAIETVLNDIVSGNINCDQIAEGKKDDVAYTPASVYKALYALHNALGFSIDEICEKVFNAEFGKDKEVMFTKDGVSYAFDISPIQGQYRGYRADMVHYMNQAARDAYTIIEVQKILREIGHNDTKRHVGANVLCLNRTNAITQIINKLKSIYAEHIETKVVSSVMRNTLHQHADLFACRALFEIYHTGKCSFFGLNDVEPYEAPQDMQDVIVKELKIYTDSIQAFSVYAQTTTSTMTLKSAHMDEEVSADYSFGVFCTNAYMCQDMIIPHKGFTIPEVSLLAVWNDYRMKPNVMEQLIQRGIITKNHQPFKLSYPNLKFLNYGDKIASSPYSLIYYVNNAMEEIADYKKDKSETYMAVTHPIEYIYDNLYTKEPIVYTGDINLYPEFRIGMKRELTKDDYADELAIDNVNTDKVGVFPFHGFHTDVFRLKLNPLLLIPEVKDNKRLLSNNNVFMTSDTKQVYDYTRVKELETAGYPVKHVLDNLYLAKVGAGEIMEVYV